MSSRTKRMNRGSAVVLVLLIIVGVVIGILWSVYARSLKKEIYVFKTGYTCGTAVTADMFELIEIDGKLYDKMQGAGMARYMGMDELNNCIANRDRLVVDVPAYLPATSNLFAGNVGVGVESRLGEYKTAVALNAGEVRGIAGNEIYAGSTVNIISSEISDGKTVTEILFENVPVLGTVKKDGAVSAVYVELEPADTTKLENALLYKTVSVTMNKPNLYLELESKDRTYTEELPDVEPETVIVYETVPAPETAAEGQ